MGAGAGGLGLAIGLRRCGRRDFVVFESSEGVGGTWPSNTYPGAACDVPSHLSSYSFAMKPDWSRTYATQPEIHAYFEDCADRDGVRPHLRTNVELEEALAGTVWSDGCASSFKDAHGHVATQLPGTSRWYADRTRRCRMREYVCS